MLGQTDANYTGTQLEKFINDRLIEKKYTFVSRDKFLAAAYLDQPIYTRQFHIGQSIYETELYCDFIIYHPQKHPQCLAIESKWQEVGGSVDEKFPFFVLNIQQRYNYKVIVLLDGGGYKKKAAEWLKNQRGNNLLEVFSMAEFQKWANRGHI